MKKILLSFVFLTTVITGVAQCTEEHSTTGASVVTTGYNVGQSFIAQCSGTLNYVQLTAMTTGVIPAGTLTVYPGNGVTGSPIYSKPFNAITIQNVGDSIRIILSGIVPVVAANQYTFEFFVNLDLASSFGLYAGGDSFQAGANMNPIDFDFEVEIVNSSIVSEQELEVVSIYPNPILDELTISILDKGQVAHAIIYNGVGQEMFSNVLNDNQTKIDFSVYEPGVYFVKILNGSQITTERVVKL